MFTSILISFYVIPLILCLLIWTIDTKNEGNVREIDEIFKGAFIPVYNIHLIAIFISHLLSILIYGDDE